MIVFYCLSLSIQSLTDRLPISNIRMAILSCILSWSLLYVNGFALFFSENLQALDTLLLFSNCTAESKWSSFDIHISQGNCAIWAIEIFFCFIAVSDYSTAFFFVLYSFKFTFTLQFWTKLCFSLLEVWMPNRKKKKVGRIRVQKFC